MAIKRSHFPGKFLLLFVLERNAFDPHLYIVLCDCFFIPDVNDELFRMDRTLSDREPESGRRAVVRKTT